MIKTIFAISSELIIRFAIGYLFISSGWGKVHDINKVTHYFESLHIPLAAIQAPMVAGIELAAGLMILIGFRIRYAAVPLIGIMVVAILTAKLEDISDLSSLLEVPEFLYLLILLGLSLNGSKCFSFDSALSKKRSSLQQ